MHNTSTIYRFYTPFLDIENEKNNLTGVMEKIEKSLVFDGVNFNKKTEELDKYFKITLNFNNEIGKIDFYYLKKLLKEQYYLPVFKCDIYLANKFFQDNSTKKRAIMFLNNIFECFDGLTEKEYLIDMDNALFYKNGFFSSKKYPNYDFRDLEDIRTKFEKKGGIKMLEEFITKLKTGDFILTKNNSNKYHSFYGMLLYFIYLVYIMHLNIIKTSKTVKELEDLGNNLNNDGNIVLMKKRLDYIDNLNMYTYTKYKEKLEIFFNLLR